MTETENNGGAGAERPSLARRLVFLLASLPLWIYLALFLRTFFVQGADPRVFSAPWRELIFLPAGLSDRSANVLALILNVLLLVALRTIVVRLGTRRGG